MTTHYEVHDNGGRPFTVILSENAFDVQKQSDGTSVASGAYEHAHIGGLDGNSVLLHLEDNMYLWIGWKVIQFQLHENSGGVLRYESPIGNNDVPYPYAITADGATYLFLEQIYTFDIPVFTDMLLTYRYIRSHDVQCHPLINKWVVCGRQ